MPTKVGERFTMHWKHSELSPSKAAPPEWAKDMDEKGHSDSMTLLAYEPPHRLTFTFGENKYSDAPEVEFLLKPEGDKVRLSPTARCPIAAMRSVSRAAGTLIWMCWNTSSGTKRRRPSGTSGAAMTAPTTNATASSIYRRLCYAVPNKNPGG